MPDGDETDSDDAEPPASADAFPECVAGTPVKGRVVDEATQPPATVSGGKRKSRGRD